MSVKKINQILNNLNEEFKNKILEIDTTSQNQVNKLIETLFQKHTKKILIEVIKDISTSTLKLAELTKFQLRAITNLNPKIYNFSAIKNIELRELVKLIYDKHVKRLLKIEVLKFRGYKNLVKNPDFLKLEKAKMVEVLRDYKIPLTNSKGITKNFNTQKLQKDSLRDLVRETQNQINQTSAELSGNGIFKVIHAVNEKARPFCEPWQSKLIDVNNILGGSLVRTIAGQTTRIVNVADIQFYKKPGGLFGKNCRHSPAPIRFMLLNNQDIFKLKNSSLAIDVISKKIKQTP